MSKPSIIVDIDGTLADCEHRVHHIQGMSDEKATFKADWDAFYENCAQDEPIQPTIDVVSGLAKAGWAIILMTGRSDKYRLQTEAWLDTYGIVYDMLLMRKHGDHTDDWKIKQEWLCMLHGGRLSLPGVEPPWVAIEDRSRVVEMWRSEGLICLQCAKGDF